MAFQQGSPIQPQLGAVDFSPMQRGAEAASRSIMQGTARAAEMRANTGAIQGQMFANLGQQIGQAVQQIGLKQEQKKQKEAEDAMLANIGKTLMGNQQMGGPNQAGMNANMTPIQKLGRQLYTDKQFRSDMQKSDIGLEQLTAFAQLAQQQQQPPRRSVEDLMGMTPSGYEATIEIGPEGPTATYAPREIDPSALGMRSADELLTKHTSSDGSVDTDSFYAEAADRNIPNSVLVEYTKDFKRRGLLDNEDIQQIPVFKQKIEALAETNQRTKGLDPEAAKDAATIQILGGGLPEDPLTGASQFPRSRGDDMGPNFAGAPPEDRPGGKPGPNEPAIPEPTEDLSLQEYDIGSEKEMEELIASGEFDQVQEAIDTGTFSIENLSDPTSQLTQSQMNSLFGLSGVTKNIANSVSDFFGADALPSEALNVVQNDLRALRTWTFVTLADELVTGKASNEVRAEIQRLLPDPGTLQQAGPRAANESLRNFVQYVEAQQTVLEGIRDNENGQYAPDARRAAANRLPILRDFILPEARKFLRAFEGLNPVETESQAGQRGASASNIPDLFLQNYPDTEEGRKRAAEVWPYIDDKDLFR